MRVALITRSTLFTQAGGDTIQVKETASSLNRLGITAHIRLTNQKINYSHYDLFHFFNLTRPADILFHIHRLNKPFVVSPILVNYSAYDSAHRKGISGMVFRLLSADSIEYAKTTGRWLAGRDVLASPSFLWKGQRNCITEILKKTRIILPNSSLEYLQLCYRYNISPPYRVVPNGIDTSIFRTTGTVYKEAGLVLCVGRIEGIKNQATLIRALNNTPYRLVLIGSPASNQKSYYSLCRRIAANNVTFIDHLPQTELVRYYQRAQVHVQPSWFETCGLSSLEAAAMGCTLVMSDAGFVREYFEDYPFYCDPADPQSILHSVEMAARSPQPAALRKKIFTNYTWSQAAAQTATAYEQALHL